MKERIKMLCNDVKIDGIGNINSGVYYVWFFLILYRIKSELKK